MRLRDEVIEALRSNGHQVRPWPYVNRTPYEQVDWDRAVANGEVHPTCSACSAKNNGLATQRAHRTWELANELEKAWID